jgi:hypothetical protein
MTMPDSEPSEPPEPMTARLADALETEAPMTRPQLDTVREHFAELARMMLISGTIFSPMRPVAVDMHRKATDRIDGVQERNEAKRREREREREHVEARLFMEH